MTDDYIHATGEKGKLRLDLMNQVYNPNTYKFLKAVGLKPGMRVLEIGTGYGHVACWMAEQVGEAGHVFCTDIAEPSLVIAENQARSKGLDERMSFIPISVYNLSSIKNKIGTPDLIFCRFVLGHLTDPAKALQVIKTIAGAKTIIAIEEADVATIQSNTASELTQKFVDLSFVMKDIFSSNIDIGSNLLTLVRKNMGRGELFNTFHPELKTQDEKAAGITIALREAYDKFTNVYQTPNGNKQPISPEALDKLIENSQTRLVENKEAIVKYAKTSQVYISNNCIERTE